MIRLILVVAAMIAVIIATVFLTLNPGRIEIEFLGRQYSTYFVLAMGALILLTFLLVVAWWGIYGLWVAPDKFRRFRARRRKEQGFDALERALIASAAGDGEAAVRQAAKADALLDRPALSRLLAARAAEAAGNASAAEGHYEALLEDPKTRIVARRGLAQLADERGDSEAAARHARDAFEKARGARWAFDALFDSQIAQSNWEAALETLAEGERRKQIAPDRARRRRAVLLTVAALGREESDSARALMQAENAAKTAPGFAPAAVLAARLLAAARKHKRAEAVLHSAWSTAPHPAIARVYRDLRKSDTKAKRAERLKGLAALQPEHRESKLLLAEIALEAQDANTARSLLAPLLAAGTPSARLGAFAARLARLEDKDEEARRWMTRAVHAPAEPDWSDIDPEGGAFAFDDSDWRRMVYVYGDEGALIHPRYERYQGAAEAVPETALLEGPRRARPSARSASGEQPAGGEMPAFDPASHQPDDPGVPDDSRDDKGAAA